MASVKGKLFEFFVCKLLLFCGFKPVVKDGLLVYDGTPGTMVQGLGQAHNADVLLEPPFQTPFYFSTRLLVECKCYNDTIGLPIIRNALGLREDINRFDIVTEDILKNRQLLRTSKPTFYPMNRYNYQVAVASLCGYKSTAITYAQAHRIPLISFAESSLFESIRECINVIEERAQENESFASNVLHYLKDYQYDTYCDNVSHQISQGLLPFIEEVRKFKGKIVIGLLENGDMIFLMKETEINLEEAKREKKDEGFMIHWKEESKAWMLHNQEQRYLFELPKEIYQEWIQSVEGQRKAAIRIKQNYFSKIVLFEKELEGREKIRTIYLSEQFIEDAKAELNML